MRPGGNADMRVMTEDLGDRTRIIVEALNSEGDRMNFVRFAGRVVGPSRTAEGIELRQTGPGRYEGVFDSAAAGAYVTNLRYIAPGEEGAPNREGNIQAAVTRPYADEFRTLADNAPLLKQVAERTGGRVIGDDPKTANLWDRTGLVMPADARPIWMLVALIALGAFLLDVAVRRVRIDPQMIAAGVRRAFGMSAETANQQLGSLKEARGRAQQSISGVAGQARQDVAKAVKSAPTESAAAKFEATEAELKGAKKNEGIAAASAPVVDKRSDTGQPAAQEGPTQAEGLSRLKKARERAQEKFEDDTDKK